MPKLPKKYLSFIESCRNKKYDNLMTHKHHILPEFMGGGNEDSNLIILSVEDHYNAHLLLSETIGDIKSQIGNKMSALYLINRYENIKVTKEEISKMMSECKKIYYENNKHWNLGNKGKLQHTEESKKLIGQSLKKFYSENIVWNKGKECPQISNSLKGKFNGVNNPFYGKKHSTNTKEKMSKNHFDVSGKNNPSSKKCIDVETGKIYDTIKDLGEFLNLSKSKTYRLLKENKKFKLL